MEREIQTMKLKRKIKRSKDVVSLILTAEDFVDFIPGQFCFVSFPGEKGKRPFSYANAVVGNEIELTLKPVGSFTTRLSKLKIGDKVEVYGPFGSPLKLVAHKEVVYITAGVGITPFMSHLRTIHKSDLPMKITLLYSNKTKDIPYKDELDSFKKFHIIYTLTQEKRKGFKNGRINKEFILENVKFPEKKFFYLCGPKQFNIDIYKILRKIKIPVKHIKREDW